MIASPRRGNRPVGGSPGTCIVSLVENFPRTRERLIEAHLTDSDIVEILTQLKRRAVEQGDWNAAKLLLEFKYGRNPEPPNNNVTLEELLMQTPLSSGQTDSE